MAVIKSMSSQTLTLGVDIGGTKIAAGVVDPGGHISLQQSAPMPADKSSDDALQAVLTVIQDVRRATNDSGLTVTNIGICAPGPLDRQRGIILTPPNLPCWRDFPLMDKIIRATGLPVKLEHDASAAALAEAHWGAGKLYRNVFYVTFGTGIGTGYILNGGIHNGSTGLAPEGGHMTIDKNGPKCPCGKKGCIEAIASGSALARRAREIAEGTDHRKAETILAMANGDPKKITTETVVLATEQNDEFAKGLLDDAIASISIWLGNIYDLLEPEAFIFGGGMGHVFIQHSERIKQLLNIWSIQPNVAQVPILPAAYGADSGLAGAAALWQISKN